jgi:hypothetical protein
MSVQKTVASNGSRSSANVRNRTLGNQLMIALLCALAVLPLGPRLRAGERMKPDEIVAKHLDSLGSAETRASVHTRMAVGECKFTYHARGTGTAGGNVVMASEGIKNFLGMKFPTTAYPREAVAYDGKSMTTSYSTPGVRTIMGDFLIGDDVVVKEGLLGGALSEAWPLLDLQARKAKLENAGTKTVNGVETFVLKYSPRKTSSDLAIRLYFDSTTFHHVRTEYEKVISAQMGRTPDESAQQTSTTSKIVEEFSDFKEEGKLTLPHTYKIQISIAGRNAVAQYDWEISLSQFTFNQNLDPGTFEVDPKPGQ